ncbi:MAG TPA: PDZ domain-containing protein [Burkholderiaceae bacterium]|nr:PDZ domain-containing protein [Burkholderiaceae bacterium]
MHEGLLRTAWAVICTMALLLPMQPAAAVDIDPDRGRLGFTVYVEVDGSYTKPILKSVWVQEIEPGSPAEASGLKVEDVILQAQGKPLAGANAREVVAMVQVPPGEKLRLLVRGTDGAQRHVTIVAGPPVRKSR